MTKWLQFIIQTTNVDDKPLINKPIFLITKSDEWVVMSDGIFAQRNYLVILATSLPFSLERGIRLSRGILHVEFIGFVYNMRGVIHSMRSNTEYVNASSFPPPPPPLPLILVVASVTHA